MARRIRFTRSRRVVARDGEGRGLRRVVDVLAEPFTEGACGCACAGFEGAAVDRQRARRYEKPYRSRRRRHHHRLSGSIARGHGGEEDGAAVIATSLTLSANKFAGKPSLWREVRRAEFIRPPSVIGRY